MILTNFLMRTIFAAIFFTVEMFGFFQTFQVDVI